MLCYYFPPLTDVASNRSVAFAKFLQKYGWHPYVVSVKNPDRSYCSVGNEKPPNGIPIKYVYSLLNAYTLFGKLNGAISRILSVFNLSLKRNYFYDLFCYPDPFFSWIPLTTLTSFNLIRKHKIDIIFSTSAPFSSAVIGVFLKILTRRPLVLDFQDPFALAISSLLRVPNFRAKLNFAIERFFLSYTDLFVVTTEEIRTAYTKRYPEFSDKIFTIHNGFEPELLPKNQLPKYSKFTIIYAGQFYDYFPNMQIYTDAFFRAVSTLRRDGIIHSSDFQFLFFGDDKSRIDYYSNAYGIEDVVNTNPRISRSQILEAISRSHLQLLRIVKPMIPTKLFEAIGLNVPLLAIIPEGEVADILRCYSPSSCIITDANYRTVKNSILTSFNSRNANVEKPCPRQELLSRFSREALSLQLVHLIENHFRL